MSLEFYLFQLVSRQQQALFFLEKENAWNQIQERRENNSSFYPGPQYQMDPEKDLKQH